MTILSRVIKNKPYLPNPAHRVRIIEAKLTDHERRMPLTGARIFFSSKREKIIFISTLTSYFSIKSLNRIKKQKSDNIRKLLVYFKKGALISIDNVLHDVSIRVIVKSGKAYFLIIKIPIIGIFMIKKYNFLVLFLALFIVFIFKRLINIV